MSNTFLVLIMNVLKKLIYLTYIIYLSYLSLKSVKVSEPPFPHFDKVAHFIAHSILTFLFLINWNEFKKAFLQSLFIGVAIEIAQYFLPYRSFDLLDMLANCLGSLYIMYVWKITPKKIRSILLGKPLPPGQ
jgi:VanZ family protein